MRRHPRTSIEKPAFATAVWLAMIVPCLTLICAANPIDFRSQIAPLLERHCLRCHNPGNAKGELSLATLADAKRGGGSGAAITPEDASDSRLMEMITPYAPGQADMPEDTSPLKPEQIELLRRWIDAGAAWPEDITLREPSKADRSWWSLQPLTDAAPPNVSADAPRAWRDNPIDRFVFWRLADSGLTPNPPANRHMLLRRVTYDLTGLPPTPEEVATFVADRSPDAYANVVDRLLASPRYGERWGRHWLDVVRFGESVGFEQNYILDSAWPFRDYIIRSFNDDKPFDRLVLEHLAGDVIAKDDPAVEIGTAFLVCGPYDTVKNQDAAQAAQIRANTLDEIIRATGETFLGMTIGCARCHDHKFDPIRTDDYYQFYATFAGVKHGERVIATLRQKQEYAATVVPLQRDRKALLAKRKQIVRNIDAQVIEREAEVAATWTRPAVDRYGTEERFAPIEAKFVRLTVLGRDDNPNARVNYRIDEFEIFDAAGRNVGLGSAGAVARGRVASRRTLPVHTARRWSTMANLANAGSPRDRN